MQSRSTYTKKQNKQQANVDYSLKTRLKFSHQLKLEHTFKAYIINYLPFTHVEVLLMKQTFTIRQQFAQAIFILSQWISTLKGNYDGNEKPKVFLLSYHFQKSY